MQIAIGALRPASPPSTPSARTRSCRQPARRRGRASCAAEPGLVATDTACSHLVADAAFDDVTAPDILVVPGGLGTRGARRRTEPDRSTGSRAAHATTPWTTSVCTGVAAARRGRPARRARATTHWLRLRRARRATAPARRRERVVMRGQDRHRRRRLGRHRHGPDARRPDRRRRGRRRPSSSASSTTRSRRSTPARPRGPRRRDPRGAVRVHAARRGEAARLDE